MGRANETNEPRNKGARGVAPRVLEGPCATRTAAVAAAASAAARVNWIRVELFAAVYLYSISKAPRAPAVPSGHCDALPSV